MDLIGLWCNIYGKIMKIIINIIFNLKKKNTIIISFGFFFLFKEVTNYATIVGLVLRESNSKIF